MTRRLARHIDAASLRLLHHALHAPPPTAAHLARLSGLLRRIARLLRPPDPEALALRARLDAFDREVYPYRLARRHAAYHAGIRAELPQPAAPRLEFANLGWPPTQALAVCDAAERLTTATIADAHEDEADPWGLRKRDRAELLSMLTVPKEFLEAEPCYLSHARGRLLYRPGTGYVGAMGPRVRVTVTDDDEGRTLTVERHDGVAIPRVTMEALGAVLARYLGRTPTAEVLASVLAEAEAVLEGGDSRPN